VSASSCERFTRLWYASSLERPDKCSTAVASASADRFPLALYALGETSNLEDAS